MLAKAIADELARVAPVRAALDLGAAHLRLWRAHLPPQLPLAGELALDKLARKYQLAGGYIRNACLRAAFLAAQEESALDQRHLERAVTLEFAELGKLSSSGALE